MDFELCTSPWAYYQIGKIAGYACAGNAQNVFPQTQLRDPDMRHATCVTHVPWCMPGSLTSGFLWSRGEKVAGKTLPAFSAHVQPVCLGEDDGGVGLSIFHQVGEIFSSESLSPCKATGFEYKYPPVSTDALQYIYIYIHTYIHIYIYIYIGWISRNGYFPRKIHKQQKVGVLFCTRRAFFSQGVWIGYPVWCRLVLGVSVRICCWWHGTL